MWGSCVFKEKNTYPQRPSTIDPMKYINSTC